MNKCVQALNGVLIKGKSLINHRERFVFDVDKDLKDQYRDCLEVYYTYVESTYGLEGNIVISFVDACGKTKNKQDRISKQLKCWNNKFYQTVYDFIA